MKCKLCKKTFRGRTDKIFCTVKCKSTYHQLLTNATNKATNKIDKILHRNRSILLEIMGKHETQMKVPTLRLEQKKFNFNYITKYLVSSKGKTYHYVYDFAWMTFSDDEVLIIKHKKN